MITIGALTTTSPVDTQVAPVITPPEDDELELDELDELELLLDDELELEELELLLELDDEELEELDELPLGAEHSLTPPATRDPAPNVDSWQRKLPLISLKVNVSLRPYATLVFAGTAGQLDGLLSVQMVVYPAGRLAAYTMLMAKQASTPATNLRIISLSPDDAVCIGFAQALIDSSPPCAADEVFTDRRVIAAEVRRRGQ